MSWEAIEGLTVPSPPPDNTDSANFNFRFPDYAGDANVWGYGLNGNWYALDFLLHKFVTDASYLPLYLPKAGGEMSGDFLFATTGAKCGTSAKPASEMNALAWNVRLIPGGAVTASCTGAGVITGTGITNSSDERLKKNIREVDERALFLGVMALAVKFYERKADNATELGLIAQDVQKHLPHCIGRDAHGMLTISQNQLLASVIGAFGYAMRELGYAPSGQR